MIYSNPSKRLMSKETIHKDEKGVIQAYPPSTGKWWIIFKDKPELTN